MKQMELKALIRAKKAYRHPAMGEISEHQDAFFIPPAVLHQLSATLNKRLVEHHEFAGRGYQTSYSYITDLQFKFIAILNIPYFENDTFNERALEGSLYNLAIVYFSLLVVVLTVAYFISKYITKSLKTIENRLEKTRLLSQNEKILLKSAPAEITELDYEIGRASCRERV